MSFRACRRLYFAAGLMAVGLAGLSAHAQNTIRVPQDYATIQAAINAAADGDTVSVAPGTYAGAVSFGGKGVQLVSTGGAGSTTIDGTGVQGPVVSITGPLVQAVPMLSGFTVRVQGSTSNGSTSLVSVSNTVAIVQGNTLSGAFCSAIVSSKSGPTINNNVITGTLTTGCAAGEGLGSAIVVTGFYSNGTYPAITKNLIQSNVASVAAASDKGGGAALNITNSNHVVVAYNRFRNNTSTGYGGAVYVATTPSIYFTGNIIYGNTGISGGIDMVVPGSSVGDPVGGLLNNTIVGNSALGAGTGSASDVYVGGNLSQYILVNNIIGGYQNGQIALNCGAQYSSQTLTPLVFDHNDIYSLSGTTSTPVGGACSSPAGTFGNISADPQFLLGTQAAITAGNANLHLTSGSPAIDSGNNSVGSGVDYDGNVRPQDATGKGYAVIDMGAYEYLGLQNSPNDGLFVSPSSYTPTAGATFTLNSILIYSGTAAPTGTVTFSEDGAVVGAVAVGTPAANATQANQSLTLSGGLVAGLHTFTATYSGPGTYPPVTSFLLYVRASPAVATSTQTTLVSSLNPSNVGIAVTFTAHVAASGSVPAGTVNFADGAVAIGSAAVDASGNAAITTSTLAQGSRSITASFVPGTGYVGSLATLTQVVNGAVATASLTVTPGSGAAGVSQTLLATVSGAAGAAPTGTVTFYVDGAVLGPVTLVAANTTSSTASSSIVLPAGSHSITCTYTGDVTYTGASCSAVAVTITAIATTSVLTVSPAGATAGTPLTLTATVTPATKTSGTPTGMVTFYDGTTVLGVSALNAAAGNASLTVMLNAGPHTLSCVYAGDSTYASSSCAGYPLTLALAPTALTLASAANPTPALAPVKFTAHLTLTSGGAAVSGATVAFTVDGVVAGSAVSDTAGNAVFTSTGLSAGTHTVAASFAADAQHGASASPTISELAVTNPTSTTLIGAPNPGTQNQPVTLVATVAALTGTTAPVGNVEFTEGSTVLALYPLQPPASGVAASATLVISTLAPGTHVILATYVPSTTAPYIAAFSGSQPATLTITIHPQSFTIAPTSPTLTIQTEHHGSIGVSLVSIGGLQGQFMLSCGPLPDSATCTFAQSYVGLPANGTVTTNLTIDTDVIPGFKSSSTPASLGRQQEISFAALLPLGLLVFGLRRRRALAGLCSVLLLVVMAGGLSACSGKYPAHTPPGTYTIQLRATGVPVGSSVSQTQTGNLTLVVTP